MRTAGSFSKIRLSLQGKIRYNACDQQLSSSEEFPMMNNNEMLLLKLGEVVLKGLNRRSFEDRLTSNVRRRLKGCGSFQIYIRQSTIYVEPQNDACDMEAAYAAAQQVFGVVSVARAVPCDKTVEAIVDTAKTYLAEEFAKAQTFKVESKRADKQFRLNSIQISQEVGGDLAELFPNVAVDVHHPDLTVYVEIREKYAYVHAPAVPGAGGLPVGMGGHAVSLLSGGLDSPVSSWMMARRGVELEMVHFVSPPYTSQQAQDKVLELARLLTAYCGRMIVHIVPFTEIQEEIRKNCPEEYFTLIMRRFMMRLAEAVAKKAGAKALITGESLGQVASQTMMALSVTEDVTTMPVLRPLIGMDKVEIIRISRQIGTYETSILPYEDCCTVFTPRHPATRPNLEDVRQAESALDVDALVARALAGETWVRVKAN
jgi:thiamine biosynthesis protein ThiI